MCHNYAVNSRALQILDIIAVEVLNSNQGDFLRSFAEAWQRADPFNKRIIQKPWIRLIDKYELRKKYKDIIARELKRIEVNKE